jgi:hypothetical protein
MLQRFTLAGHGSERMNTGSTQTPEQLSRLGTRERHLEQTAEAGAHGLGMEGIASSDADYSGGVAGEGSTDQCAYIARLCHIDQD